MKKIIDLTHTISSDIPTWDGDCHFQIKIETDYKDCEGPVYFRTQNINMGAGTGTHMDSPAHASIGGKTVDSLSLDELVNECIVIKKETDDEKFVFTRDFIENFENKHGKIKENTFVIFYSGWSKRWGDKNKYRNNLLFPSVHVDTAQLLLDRKISGIGIDTLSADSGGKEFPVHQIILGAGKYLVENIHNADLLPEIGARIFVMPVKIKDATESPLRLIAEID